MINNFPMLRKYVSGMPVLEKMGIISSGTIGCLRFVFDTIDAEKSYRFFDGLATGANMSADDPVKMLRDKLVFVKYRKRLTGDSTGGDIDMKKGVKHYRSGIYIAGLVIKAWNRHFNGERTKILKFADNEEFPTVSGCNLRSVACKK